MPKAKQGTIEGRARKAQQRSKGLWVELQERREGGRFLPRSVEVRVPVHLRARLVVLAEKLQEQGQIKGRRPYQETLLYLLERLDGGL